MGDILFQNTLSGKKERFEPQRAGEVRMYTCGPTVYDYAHIGNYRTFVFQDILRRFLRSRGFTMRHVMNLTDVDDRIIENAAAQGISINQYTGKYSKAFLEDIAGLSVETPEHIVKATDHIEEMVALIERLGEKSFTYHSDGSIYYRIAQFPAYGKLSKIDFSGIRAGASERIESDRYEKEDARDFALWKAPKPGEHSWQTRIGPGRPGWHIECSAMAMKYLGETLDIHTGGVDLAFPHHENEIAQSEAATGKPFARFWLHAEHLIIEGEKMSKSLGNVFTLREVLPRLRDPEVLRYFFVSSHYRGPVHYSLDLLEQADAALGRLYTALRDLSLAKSAARSQHTQRFEDAMDDDLNTPEAVAVLQTLAREINSARDAKDARRAATLGAELKRLGSVLGLLQRDPEEWLKSASRADADPLSNARIEELIAARAAARKAKHWAESDRIRDELARA
ncbi:MAG: cysteine--tRNA ligase, partial [Candidatus Acidiferrales bacterium]